MRVPAHSERLTRHLWNPHSPCWLSLELQDRSGWACICCLFYGTRLFWDTLLYSHLGSFLRLATRTSAIERWESVQIKCSTAPKLEKEHRLKCHDGQEALGRRALRLRARGGVCRLEVFRVPAALRRDLWRHASTDLLGGGSLGVRTEFGTLFSFSSSSSPSSSWSYAAPPRLMHAPKMRCAILVACDPTP